MSSESLISDKPRIVIYNFEDKSGESNTSANAIMDMMVTELHKSGAFTLLERERFDDVAREFNLAQSGVVDPATAPKVGRIMGAEYIVRGAITLSYYSEKASGSEIPLLGTKTKAKTAYTVIDLRIIDVETGEIVYASDKSGEATNKEKKNITKSSKVIGGLLSMATRNAVNKHVSAMKNLSL